jgi:TRAP-type C4-dicarboxylate transport system substrate-binding protein
MVIATEYTLEDEASIPLVQTLFVQYLKEATSGALAVSLVHSGKEGVGVTLVRKVREGEIEAAQFSLANFAALAPIVDLVNIPYWCGGNQEYVNLVTSEAWLNRVDPQLAAQGFKVLFYYTEGPRTIARRREPAANIIRTPREMTRLRVRVPPSKAAAQFYTLAGATPVVIPWDDSRNALRRGTVDAVDPSVSTLHAAGFDADVDSVSLMAQMPDAQVYACNLEWFDSLPLGVQTAIGGASERAMIESLSRVASCQASAMAQMATRGVRFHSPSTSELREWIETTGAERAEWSGIKTDLVGSSMAFNALRHAANTRGPYVVPVQPLTEDSEGRT